MASLAREFLSALKSTFGAVGGGGAHFFFTRDVQSISSLVYQGPAEVYRFTHTFSTLITSASFALLDATASGIGGNAVFQWWCQSGGYSSEARPLRFDKGIVLSFTATGATNAAAFTILYSPTPTPFGGAG